MPWNEPGGNGQKDPWGRPDKKGGPPDLDEIARKLQEKLKGLFGGRRGGDTTGMQKRSTGGPVKPGMWIIVLFIAIILLLWEISYIVEPAERGVVLRFGSYAATLDPGLNFRLPRPIEQVTKVDVDQIRSVPHKATMLTRDENIVDMELAVQYRVKDVTQYLFNVRTPDVTLRQVTESALRDMVGNSTLDFVLTAGRTEIAAGTKEHIQSILDQYQAGLLVTSVNMQPAKPPEEVKPAFDDAIKAREDQQRLINEAEAYRNEVLPKSRGAAARVLAEANAHKFKVIAEAKGEANRFELLLAEYQKAPKVTRQRLYLNTVESVLSKTSKVVIDTKGGNNILYLPLDKLIERGTQVPPSMIRPSDSEVMVPEAIDPTTINQTSSNLRRRDMR
ncbi:MAG: FtsH protease activity modulator HflK [Gammaproteobacteria bacterium]